MNIWSYDTLWQKAKLYARRTLEEDRDDPAFALWSTLALEFVARATLAHLHPALLADPREPENIHYAFGFRTEKSPKSIPAKALFARCEVTVASFTSAERKFAMTLIERRNEELHSGTPAFHDFPSGLWLSEYFRVCQILLDAQGKKLGHLIGGEEAKVARKMIRATQTDIRSNVFKEIAKHRDAFDSLDPSDQDEKRENSRLHARASALGRPLSQRLRCPACPGYGLQTGQRVRAAEPVADEDSILIRTVVLPTRFDCYCCGLRLGSHAEVHFADLGDQFTTSSYLEPSEFYGLEYPPDASDYYDEYFNE
jgi:hypothetical protein